MTKFTTRIDCRRFRGDMPCYPMALCENCRDYEPMGSRILLIKLGAIGDVLRTTPILPALRAKYPAFHITWIVDEESAPLLRNNRFIDRLVLYGPEAIIRVSVESYDLVLSFDKHPGAAGLAEMAKAELKIGFVLDSETGNISSVGEGAQYTYRLGLDDNLKFRINKKTYQQMIFEMIGLEWQGENYILDLPDEMRDAGRGIVKSIEFRGKGPLIGLNTGAGKIWPMKRWTVAGFAELADRLVERFDARVMLLGAGRDFERNIEIQAASRVKHPLAPHDLSILEFAGLLSSCDAVVTGDTAAMHLGLALGVPTVSLFGPTSANEVEMYKCGRAIVATSDCAPCYKSKCSESPTCMDRISVDVVFDAVANLLKKF